MKFIAKAYLFYEILFEENVVTQMSPLEWWKTHFNSSFCKEKEKKKAVKQLLTAVATSASVE